MAPRLEVDPELARAALARLAGLVDELASAAARVYATRVDPAAGGASGLDPWAGRREVNLAERRDELARGIGCGAVDLALSLDELRRYVERVSGHDERVAAEARALRSILSPAGPGADDVA
jgi:hypothetical protein